MTEKVTRSFTKEELQAFKDRLARQVREHLELKGRRKEAVDGFNALLKNVNDEITQISDQLEKGYEWVDGEVAVLLDRPERGQKTIVRVDTGEELRTEPMTHTDRQQVLGLEEDPTVN